MRARVSLNRRARWALAAALLLAGALLLALLGGAGLRGRDRTWERIQAEGVMRIGLDASFPPFETIDPATGAPAGLDVDLAKALGRELGDIRPEFLNVGFDGLYDSLLSGRFDAVISALPVERVWTEDVSYTSAYFEAGLVIVTQPALQAAIANADDLTDRMVAVEWGSEGDAYGRALARRLPSVKLLPLATPDEVLAAVEDGRAQAGLIDAVSAYLHMGGSQNNQLAIAGDPLTEVSYAVAIRQSSPHFARAMDEALERLRDSGELDALIARWFQAVP